MPSRRTRSLRFLLPLVLAAVLAGEITGIALAHTIAAPAPAATAASAAAASIAGTVGSAAATVPSEATGADAARDPLAALAGRTRSDLVAKAARPVALPAVARVAKTPLTGAAKSGTGHGAAGGSKAAYRGTNHVWIPSLGDQQGHPVVPVLAEPAAGRRRVPLGLRRDEQRVPPGPRLEHVQAAPRCLCQRPAPQGDEGHLRRRRRARPHVLGDLVEGHRPDHGRVVGVGVAQQPPG